MSGKVVAENEWCEILHNGADGVLEMRWLPVEMNDAAFKASLALLALEAERLRPGGILIDATEFRHRPGPDIMEWRNNAILHRYGSAGVRKFAFHAPPGAPGTMEAGGKEQVDGPAVFPTAWFAERQHARDWLMK